MKHSGFTLIEFLVYISLFSIVVLLVNQWVAMSLLPTQKSMKRMRSVSSLHAASEVLTRDVHAGSQEEQKWYIIEDQKIAWQINQSGICWEIRDNLLFRSEGSFNNGIFNKNSENLVGQNIDGSFLIKKKHGKIRAVECLLRDGNEQVTIIALPRLGVAV
jgi:prepilin-type N-terminal cleavage/methylation domain-containing protein